MGNPTAIKIKIGTNLPIVKKFMTLAPILTPRKFKMLNTSTSVITMISPNHPFEREGEI